MKDQTYIAAGDFIDLYYKVKHKGWRAISSFLHIANQVRTASKWDAHIDSSDFWIIPEVRKRWNEKCTGDPALEYEDYIMSNYFAHAHDLRMLSVGCGTGARERKFGKYSNFKLIEGIDLAPGQIEAAKAEASQLNLNHLRYYAGDFTTHEFVPGTYDVILFNSSLHHFRHIAVLLQEKILPLLNENGYLILFEYVGPNRLQATRAQLDFANRVLQELPSRYRVRFQDRAIKKRIYRPGVWRIVLMDPSEAGDSESILPAVHEYCKVIEEKKVGWDILQLVLKGIAHNFLVPDEESQSWLRYLFKREDEYLERTGRSDAIFGIYQKK